MTTLSIISDKLHEWIQATGLDPADHLMIYMHPDDCFDCFAASGTCAPPPGGTGTVFGIPFRVSSQSPQGDPELVSVVTELRIMSPDGGTYVRLPKLPLVPETPAYSQPKFQELEEPCFPRPAPEVFSYSPE